MFDNIADGIVAQNNLPILEASRLHLSADQIATRDFEFLGRGIAAERDDFHSIAQRSGHWLE